ncbi:hypothetical protein B0H66DRAFT_632573 [Apodospora peruviana]|uniref:Uncharacterized protein n=1 Tax=Apodospora peruviana TaxID=516989 RepID=A0AAE0HT27_9PEZI|nr:hypothetical protein B0H66DRAFT_632573 [Apodospora peruviana]
MTSRYLPMRVGRTIWGQRMSRVLELLPPSRPRHNQPNTNPRTTSLTGRLPPIRTTMTALGTWLVLTRTSRAIRTVLMTTSTSICPRTTPVDLDGGCNDPNGPEDGQHFHQDSPVDEDGPDLALAPDNGLVGPVEDSPDLDPAPYVGFNYVYGSAPISEALVRELVDQVIARLDSFPQSDLYLLPAPEFTPDYYDGVDDDADDPDYDGHDLDDHGKPRHVREVVRKRKFVVPRFVAYNQVLLLTSLMCLQ